MYLHDFLDPSAINLDLTSPTKDEVLDEMVALLGLDERSTHQLGRLLKRRELLGSTGVGRGIAIPHCRLPAIHRIACVFARLEAPIPFDAIDGEPVDLVFLLLAPENAGADHLKALARLSRLMREPQTILQLRAAKDQASLHAILTEPLASHAA